MTKIVHKGPITLLGAGASVPAGLPTANQLTDLALESSKENTPFMGNNGAVINPSDIRQALHFVVAAIKLHDVRAQNDRLEETNVEIERLVSAVELLSNRTDLEITPFIREWDPLLSQLETNLSRSDSAAKRFVEEMASYDPSGRPPGKYGRELRRGAEKVARSFIAAIRETTTFRAIATFSMLHEWLVKRLVDDLSLTETSSTSYLEPLLKHLQSSGGILASLNYDLTVETCAANAGVPLNLLVDHWEKTGELDECAEGIPYLKLHGSINWEERDEDRLAVRSQLESRSASHPALIYGQREKLRSRGPFLQLLEMFRRSLGQSERLVISGYSFGDEHINTLIRRWLCHKAATKMVVVDPGFPDTSTHWPINPQREFWRLYGSWSGAGSSAAGPKVFFRREGIAEFAEKMKTVELDALFDNVNLTEHERLMARQNKPR
ncbi:SIR2 family protein [Arthrobacter pigmenti]